MEQGKRERERERERAEGDRGRQMERKGQTDGQKKQQCRVFHVTFYKYLKCIKCVSIFHANKALLIDIYSA